MRFGELDAQQNLVVPPRFDQAAPAQVDLIQQAAAVVGQRDQMAADRIVEAGDINTDIGHHPGFDLIDAGDGFDASGQRQRRAFK